MTQVKWIFLLLLWIEKTNLEMRLNRVSEPSVLSDFMIKIFTNHLGPVRKMAIVFPAHFVEVTKIIQGMNVPVILNAEETPLLQGLDMRKPCEVVLLVEMRFNISQYLQSTLWTSKTFFVLILRHPDFSRDALTEIFQTFWAENVINVFVFVTTSQNISVYSYRSFNFPECDSIELDLLDPSSKDFTLSRQMNNLNGCLLNISVVDLPPLAIFPDEQSRNGTFELQGIETNIIYEISRKINFTPKFAVARDGEAWGWIHPSPHGVVGEVFEKSSHFGFGLLATTLERYERLDMSVPVSPLRECITWAVPIGAAKSQSVWIGFFVNEFSSTLWLCIVLLFVFVSLLFWKISKVFSSSDFTKTIMYLYSAFIFVPVRTPTFLSLRVLFLSWIWYAFIVMISYQSLMGSKLTVPFHQRDIDTIRDLLDSDLHFTGFYNTFRLITYGAEGDLKKVEERLEPTTYGIKEAIIYIVFERNIAYLRETTSFKYYTVINVQAKGKVHFMKECAYQYYPIMVLQKYSPLTNKTNDVITRLFESGILMHWRNKYIYFMNDSPPPAIKLTLNHMLALFAAFFLGICSSIITFSVELLSHQFSGRV